jgi:CDP-glycerol glycerophosphotransferase
VRHRVMTSLRRVVAAAISAGLRVVPVRPHAVVYGLPATEGNAVEVVRALLRRYRGVVYWLDAPPPDLLRAYGIAASPKLRCVPRLSPRGVVSYLTAELVLFTHGLYGNPSPPARRVFVNLWHGDGIKANDSRMRSHDGGASSRYVVGSTTLLTDRKARDLGLDPSRAIIVGNPRTDQLRVAPPPGALGRLGLSDTTPFVVWMPTFRVARQSGVTAGWSDAGLGDPDELARQIQLGIDVLTARGIAVAVRFHPLDGQPLSFRDVAVLGDDQLRTVGVGLYRVLGAAAGLISDYSSVVTDFLLLDRPIGFVVPDRDAYRAGRGLYPPDAMDWLPGPVLDTTADFAAYADDIVSGGNGFAATRRDTRQRLGLVEGDNAADALLAELAARQLAAGRPIRGL